MGKELHRQVGMGILVTSVSLGGVMVSILARNARYVGSIPAVGTLFPIFIIPTTYASGTLDVKGYAVSLSF